MKKLKYLLILVLIAPLKVYAANNAIILSCDSTDIYVGKSVNCNLKGITDGKVNGIESDVTITSNLEMSNVSVSDGWQGSYEDNKILLYTDENKEGEFNILSFTLTAKEKGEGVVTFDKIGLSSGSFSLVSIDSKEYHFNLKLESDDEVIPEDKVLPNDGTNPDSGSFLSITLVCVLLSIGLIAFIKTKNKYLIK